MKNVFRFDAPQGASSIVVADSPHSGRDYPADFDHAAKREDLRHAEDMAVDQLYGFLPELGVPFLQAQFPRSYIDVNRPDTVTEKFNAEGEQDYKGTESSLVREKISPRDRQPVYSRKLKLSEVFNRVASYHKPYHDRLKQMLDDTQAKHGRVVHLNLHSMPSTVNAGKGKNSYDIIIGTRGGLSSDTAIAEKLQSLFAAKGYKTGLDVSGYKGAEIVKRHGDPAKGRHSIQVELNRKLYMDEKTLELSANMPKVQRDLKDIVAEFTVWCEAHVPVPKKSGPKSAPPAP